MLKAVGEAFSVVRSGARLWLRHWPVLLTVALFAMAGRMGAQWAALRLGDLYNTLGILTLVLSPLSVVVGIVLILHTLRHSMPTLRRAGQIEGPQDPLRHRERRLIDILASVLVPFLAVYASYGLLKEDIDRYVNSVYGEEFAQNDYFAGAAGLGNDGSRLDIGSGWVAVMVIVVAVALRFGLAKLEGGRKGWGFGLLGAYVETLWLATIAVQLTVYQDVVLAWFAQRRAVAVFVDGWEALLERLGPFAAATDQVAGFVIAVLAGADALIIVPVAWLTVGAVVYGHKLTEPAAPPQPRILNALPGPVRSLGVQVGGELTARFTGFFGGLRQLAAAGLAPMLIFCLAFLASRRVEDGLNELARLVVGPQAVAPWLAFGPHVTTITRALGLTVTLCLLAAAVDRVLARGGGVRMTDDEMRRTSSA